MMRQVEIGEFVKDAVECSVYLAPRAPGLAYSELIQIGKIFGYHEGELVDAIGTTIQASVIVQDGERLEPSDHFDVMWDQFHYTKEPEFRDLAAFDHVRRELRDIVQKLGSGKGRIDRTVLIERGVAQGIDRHNIEVAILVSVYTKHVAEDDGVLTLARSRENYPLPSEQLAANRNVAVRRPKIEKLYPLVRDTIERRTDGRDSAVEPLDAFASRLSGLSYGVFRSWWIQAVSELERLDVSLNPVAASVLSAALVEGALTFVAKHAHGLGSGVMGSKTFDGPPQTWKIDDLVSGASSGGTSAILDAGSRSRADALVKARQRIHAGRMLVDHPKGVPDLRPEEAREAKRTAELVVRRVIDWLDRNPPAPASAAAPT